MMLLAEAKTVIEPLNAYGWIIMLLSIGAVLTLSIYCFTKVLRLPPIEVEQHLKAPLDIDTQDLDETG